MWIYRKTKTHYEVGYLILGFWFSAVHSFKITEDIERGHGFAARYCHYLNGGRDEVNFS